MEDLERVLKSHPFLADLAPEHVAFLVGCTKNLRFRAGEYLMREGEHEDTLFLIRQGTIAIEMPRPGGEAICIETLTAGDVLGVSLMTDGAAHLDCRARESVVALAIDHACLRDKMATDDRFGHALSRRLLERVYLRLARLRLQSLDVYG